MTRDERYTPGSEHWSEFVECLNELLRTTTEDKLMRAAGGNVQVVKDAIRAYNRYRETGEMPHGLLHIDIGHVRFYCGGEA